MKKCMKGTPGFLAWQRKYTLLRTILFFSISVAVYLAGYLSTGSNQNLLTIAAILGCLPASKSAVNTIMYYRYHGGSKEDLDAIGSHTGNCSVLADLVFTGYEKNFEIHHMAFRGDALIGYSANPACDAKACEKHLHGILAQNGLSEVTVHIFKERSKYLNRLDQLQELPELMIPDEQEEDTLIPKSQKVLAVLLAISL